MPMARISRDTQHSVLHTVIREHLEPFLREISAAGPACLASSSGSSASFSRVEC